MKAKAGLGARLRKLLGLAGRDETFFEQLEDILIEGDLGVQITSEVVDRLRSRVGRQGAGAQDDLLVAMKELLAGYLKVEPLVPTRERLSVFLVLGVNGVGKTTTVAKLAEHYRRHHGLERIILGAGDTFRAAAIEQLHAWGRRLDLRVVSQPPGSDPGAVIFDAISSAQSRGGDLILADTAGRMHTKGDLVRELEKIDGIVRRKLGSEGDYRKVLIVDATTGQNGLHQAEVFHEAVGVDSAILAKFDSTARGGIAVPICRRTGIPFSFLGTGEGLEDMVSFDADHYLDRLVGLVAG